MSKKYVVYIFSIALLFSLSVSALMTGCATTGSNTDQMSTSHSGSAQMIDSKKARTMMEIYMDAKSAAGYVIKNFKDDDTHYRADVMNSEGTLMNRIVVNKETGKVYFTKK